MRKKYTKIWWFQKLALFLQRKKYTMEFWHEVR